MSEHPLVHSALPSGEEQSLGSSKGKELDGHGWFIPDSALNEPMQQGLRNLMEHARRARWTNATTRKDGVERTFEADWIKHMRRTYVCTACEGTKGIAVYGGTTPCPVCK